MGLTRSPYFGSRASRGKAPRLWLPLPSSTVRHGPGELKKLLQACVRDDDSPRWRLDGPTQGRVRSPRTASGRCSTLQGVQLRL